MEAQKKQSNFGSKLKFTRIKFLASYYHSSVKDLRITVITGHSGRTTAANFLRNILQSQDQHIGLILDPSSPKDFYRQLSNIWKNGAKQLIVSLSDQSILDNYLYQIPIYALVDLDYAKPEIYTASDLSGAARKALHEQKPQYSIISHDHPDYDLISTYPAAVATYSYGQSRASDLRINRFKLYKKGTEANLTYHGDNFDVATYETGEPSIHLMAAAALASVALGANYDEIIDGIADYEPNATPATPLNPQNRQASHNDLPQANASK